MGETFNENKIKMIKQQASFDGLAIWHSAGILGQKMTVWNVQGLSTHGKQTTERIKDAAPECTVINVAPFLRFDRNGECVEHTVTYDGVKMDVSEFIDKYNIKVVTSSKQDFIGTVNNSNGKFWNKLSEKHDLCLFQSSGNDAKERDFSKNVGMVVGACKMKDGNIVRELYSDYGNGIDFVDFTGGFSGTSFSTPYLAGKCALIRQQYPDLSAEQVYFYMKYAAYKVGSIDEYGSGILLMPALEGDEMVTKTKIKMVKDGVETVIEVDRILKDGTNYIRLRDFEDVLGICEVSYDPVKNLPIVKR